MTFYNGIYILDSLDGDMNRQLLNILVTANKLVLFISFCGKQTHALFITIMLQKPRIFVRKKV